MTNKRNWGGARPNTGGARPGAGPKPKDATGAKADKRLMVRLTADQFAALTAAANANGFAASEQMRVWVCEKL